MTRSCVDIAWSEYIPHAPEVPQHAFLWLWQKEALYGGAAGGGKSDALLMAALQYVNVPGYAALILRRTYADLSLPGAIMDRANSWLRPTAATWHDGKKTWTFPSGATLTFGYLDSANDKYRYQGPEFQYIGLDELTQIRLADYTYLFSRLRKPSEGLLSKVPLRMRSASNPGGKYYQWVTDRFPVMPGDTPQMKGGRIFIPAKLDDNPHVDHTSYRSSLSELTPEEQAQLLNGDWTIRAPGPWAFRHEHLDAAFTLGQRFDELRARGIMTPPVGDAIYFGVDYGEHSHVLLGWPLEGRGWYIFKEITAESGLPDEDLAPQAVVAAEESGYGVARCRYDASKPESQRIFTRKTKELRGDLYAKPSKIAFNKYKRGSILHWRRLLSRTARGMPMGVLAISSEGCPLLKSQLYALQHKPGDTEDLVKEDDHGPDAGFALVAPDSKKAGLGGARMGEEAVA